MPGEFSVYQTFSNGQREKVRDHVDAREACEAAVHYSTCVGARLGTTVEVMITDGGDFCNFHWVFGRGVIFPPAEAIRDGA